MTRRKPVAALPTGSWLITWSDLVTLLLCFFVLLYSFSVLDVAKFREFINSFQGQGILDGGTAPITDDPPLAPDDTSTDDTAGPFYADNGLLMIHVQD